MGQSVSESDLGHGTRNYRQATPLHLSLLTIGLRCHPKQAPHCRGKRVRWGGTTKGPELLILSERVGRGGHIEQEGSYLDTNRGVKIVSLVVVWTVS
jgi:hypothetical protein